MRSVTLNIEDDSIRVLTSDGKRVINWSSVPLPEGIVQGGLIVDPPNVASRIEALIARQAAPGTKVVASVSGVRSVHRLLTLPKLKSAFVEDAIRHESERKMPVPLDELYLIWKYLGENGSQRNYFAVGVPKNLVDAQHQALNKGKVKKYTLDLKGIALSRAVNAKDALIVNLEETSFDTVLVVDGIPTIMRTLSLGKQGATRKETLNEVAVDVARTVDFHNSSHPDRPFRLGDSVYLTGKLAKEPEIRDLFREAIGTEIAHWTPPLRCPAYLPTEEYAVNLGLMLAPGANRRTTFIPVSRALDLQVCTVGQIQQRLIIRRVVYTALATLAIGLLFPVFGNVLNERSETKLLSQELNSLNRQLQQVRQMTDPVIALRGEVARLREEREAVLGTHSSFAERLNVVLEGLPTSANSTAITITSDYVTLESTASAYLSVIEYVRQVENSGFFSNVDISSLETEAAGAGDGTAAFSIKAED